MSNLEVYINDALIPAEHVKQYPKTETKMAFDGKIIPDTIDLTLDNIIKDYYDDRYSGSLFYGSDFYGQSLELFDTELNIYVFRGSIINIEINDGDNTIKIEASNYLRDLSQTPCVYANSSNKTIAQIIYEILTDADCGAIDTSYIVYKGFQRAINIQTANTAYMNVNYTASQNRNCLDVINELLRISSCYLYTKQNLIYMYQWEEYAGEIGEEIPPRLLIAGSYKHYYSDKDIYNSYSIAYDNAGSAAYATGSDATSIATYKERKFTAPNEDVGSTTSTDFNILFRNATGAAWAGALVLSRCKNMKQYAEFAVDNELKYLQASDQADLNFSTFLREPARILECAYDEDNKKIALKAEFLNRPEEYYSRDVTAPDAPALYAAFSTGPGCVLLKWTKSIASDHAGYRIYFSSSEGEWHWDTCNQGKSPVDYKGTGLTDDGYAYIELTQLSQGVEYSFKVTDYDTRFNESDFSNTLQAVPNTNDAYLNEYRITGDLFSQGIQLDEMNTRNGAVLSGWHTWPATFPIQFSPSSVYESGKHRSRNGFSALSWKGYGDAEDITMQYRQSDDGSAWDSWSSEVDAIGIGGVSLSKDYLQYRFLFHSHYWSDTDRIFIKELL